MTTTTDTPRLFDDGVMTGDDVKAVMQPYLVLARQCITASFEALERLRSQSFPECAPLTGRTIAGILHDHMVSEARKAFGGLEPDVMLNDDTGFLVVDFYGRVKMRFKRLSPHLHPYNVVTEQQEAYEHQTLFGPAATLVTAGYRLSEMGTFRDAHIVCWGASGRLWSFPLPPPAVEMPKVERLSNKGDLPEPIVRVKTVPEVQVKHVG